MCVCVSLCCVVLCIGRGLASGRSPIQGVLPIVYRFTSKNPSTPQGKRGRLRKTERKQEVNTTFWYPQNCSMSFNNNCHPRERNLLLYPRIGREIKLTAVIIEGCLCHLCVNCYLILHQKWTPDAEHFTGKYQCGKKGVQLKFSNSLIIEFYSFVLF
jgi:hypothetical protein